MKIYLPLLALIFGLTDSIFPCKAMADTHNPEANTVPQTTHRILFHRLHTEEHMSNFRKSAISLRKTECIHCRLTLTETCIPPSTRTKMCQDTDMHILSKTPLSMSM